MIIKEKNYLKEGPGAGYTITVGDYDVKSIDNVVIDSIELANDDSWSGLLIIGKCNGKVIANKLQAESYMYGTEELNNIPAEFDQFVYEYTDYLSNIILGSDIEELENRIREKYEIDTNEIVDIDDYTYPEIFDLLSVDMLDTKSVRESLKYAIDGNSTSIIYGGGYLHSTYDGRLTDTDNTSFDNENLICNLHIYPNEFYQWCTPIEYIDKAVTGDNEYETYDVWDGTNHNEIESTDDLESAIELAVEYAKSENADISDFYILHTTWKEYFNGDTDDIYDEEIWNGNEYLDEIGADE